MLGCVCRKGGGGGCVGRECVGGGECVNLWMGGGGLGIRECVHV